MQRGEPNRAAGDVLIFIGIALMAFILVHWLGLFERSTNLAPLQSLQRLPSAIASRVAPDLESARQWLRAPDVSAAPREYERSYRVQSGDTLSLIALRHDVELSVLIERNELANPDRLEIGQLLKLPGSADAAPERPEAEPGTPGLFAALEPSLRSWLWSSEAEDGAATAASDPAGSPASTPAPAAAAALKAVDELLAMAEEELRAARFDEAVHSAKAAERLVQASSDVSAMATRRARIEVVRATVHSAFGSDVEARRSLERALDANPELQLDPASSPRKLIRALEATQAEQLASAERLGSQ